MTSAFPISSRDSPARRAVARAPTFGPIGSRLMRMPDKGWRRRFDDPISLPRGRQLVTLQDAGNYITKLPKDAHATAEWQTAMEALILVAESGGPTMFARIGIMRALNRHIERVFDPDRKDHHWGKRKLKRDQ